MVYFAILKSTIKNASIQSSINCSYWCCRCEQQVAGALVVLLVTVYLAYNSLIMLSALWWQFVNCTVLHLVTNRRLCCDVCRFASVLTRSEILRTVSYISYIWEQTNQSILLKVCCAFVSLLVTMKHISKLQKVVTFIDKLKNRLRLNLFTNVCLLSISNKLFLNKSDLHLLWVTFGLIWVLQLKQTFSNQCFATLCIYTVVCLRGGERGTCLEPPIFWGPPNLLSPACATFLVELCNPITRQAIELQSCSNPLRIQQVL